MDRWWYNDENKSARDKAQKSKQSPDKRSERFKTWKFSVLANLDLNSYENIALTGSCFEVSWIDDRLE